MTNPIEILTACMYSAIYKDLPDVEELHWDHHNNSYEDIKSVRENRNLTNEERRKFQRATTRRPMIHEVSLAGMFSQTFGNTSCGHGGVAGQAFTDGYVTCITNDHMSHGLVYSSGKLLRKYDLSERVSSDKFYKIIRESNYPER